MKVNARRWLIQSPHISQFQTNIISHNRKCSLLLVLLRNCFKPSELRALGFSVQSNPYSQSGNARFLVSRCASEKFSDHFEQKPDQNTFNEQKNLVEQEKFSIVNILKQSNSLLPHVVLTSTLLALVYPPSFTWITTRYYAPALGFLMFAVGVNSSEKDFVEAFKRPAVTLVGYVGQYVVKPILGYFFGIVSVSIFGLPTPIGAGIMLVSCVSGAHYFSD